MSTPKIIGTASAIDADQDTWVAANGAHGAATFFVHVTAITRTTGTLDVYVRWRAPSGNEIDIASVTGITATGLNRLTLTSDFNATRDAIPEPNRVDWDLVGDTEAVSGFVYAVYGD